MDASHSRHRLVFVSKNGRPILPEPASREILTKPHFSQSLNRLLPSGFRLTFHA
jgi:hypothetical protein